MAGNISVTYHDMRDAAGQLSTIEGTIQDSLKQAEALVKNLVANGFVTDLASKAFDDAYSKFHQGAGQMIDGMNSMGDYLKKAADAMEQTDQGLANALKG